MLRILNVSSEVSLQADHFINLLFILIWGPPRLSLSWDKVITVINHVIYKQVMHTQVCGVTCLGTLKSYFLLISRLWQYLQYVVQHSHVQQHSHMTMWPFRDSKCVLQDEICRYCRQTFLWREMQLHVRQSDLKHAKRKVVASWVSIWPETTRYCTYCRVPLASMVRSLDNPHLWIGPS